MESSGKSPKTKKRTAESLIDESDNSATKSKKQKTDIKETKRAVDKTNKRGD